MNALDLAEGASLGERSVLADGPRAALLLDGGPEAVGRIGQLAVARLRDRCDAIARAGTEGIVTHPERRLAGQRANRPTDGSELRLAAALPPARAGADSAVSVGYLASLLCFRRFDDAAQVAQAVEGLVVRWAERDDLLTADGARPDALLLVARGAVEVTVPCRGAAHRVQLAGPGRFVGHLGVLDHGPSPVAARARERSVLIELPRERVSALLDCPTSIARRFTAAVYEDVARAVQQAERAMARTVPAGVPTRGFPWRRPESWRPSSLNHRAASFASLPSVRHGRPGSSSEPPVAVSRPSKAGRG